MCLGVDALFGSIPTVLQAGLYGTLIESNPESRGLDSGLDW